MISNATSQVQTTGQALDQTVSVSVNWAGEPVKFSWQQVTYAVIAKPTRWFDRKQWWAEAGRVQRGIGAQVLEVEMWRVLAERQTGLRDTSITARNHFQFELMHTKEGWQLISVSQPS